MWVSLTKSMGKGQADLIVMTFSHLEDLCQDLRNFLGFECCSFMVTGSLFSEGCCIFGIDGCSGGHSFTCSGLRVLGDASKIH